MAWTAPRTWVTAETVTAALMNTHIRDNLLETAAATATTDGDIVYADAANSMGNRLGIGAGHGLLVSDGSDPMWRVPATETNTGSGDGSETTYETLGTTPAGWGFGGVETEVTVTTGTWALVMWAAALSNDTSAARTILSYSVSGATTVAANDNWALSVDNTSAGDRMEAGTFRIDTGLAAGSNTFTLEGKVSAGTGTIVDPRILVIPL